MRPTGWRHEGYRHSLAAKGVKTRMAYTNPGYNLLKDVKAEVIPPKEVGRISERNPVEMSIKDSFREWGWKTKDHEYIEGGLADNVPDREFDKEQLVRGTKVELEHTNNPKIAKEIAKDHLVEEKDYYPKLEEAGL